MHEHRRVEHKFGVIEEHSIYLLPSEMLDYEGKEGIMAETVTAVYEDGILRPLSPLHLPEHSQVEIEVRLIHSAPDTHARREQVRAALDAASILAPVTPSAMSPLSEDERAALAEQLVVPGATPLSEIISEDREER